MRSLLRVPPSFGVSTDACGAVCAVAYAILAVLSRRQVEVDLRWYLLLLAAAWAATLTLFIVSKRRGRTPPLRRVLFWAAMFRLCGLVGDPLLEDDYYRYLWDGRQFAVSGNPYRDPPIEHFQSSDLPERFERILDNINHPELTTIYAPICQYAFLVSYWIAPGSLLPLKGILTLADLATIYFLLSLVGRRNLLLYAWSPLLIQETYFTAHPDSLGIALLVAAWYLAERRPVPAGVGVLCGLAAGARTFAALFIPFLLLRGRKREWAWFLLTLGLVFGPFVADGRLGSSAAMSAFLQEWEFNSSAYALLAASFGARAAGIASAFLFGAFYLGYLVWWARAEPGAPARGDWIYGVFFLLSPVLNPWYLLWLLPFAARHPSRWALAALAFVSSSYVHGLNLLGSGLPSYHHPSWLRPVEFGLIAVAGIWDLVSWKRRSRLKTEGSRTCRTRSSGVYSVR